MALLDRKKWLLKTEASNIKEYKYSSEINADREPASSLYSHMDVDKNGNLDDNEIHLVVK